MKAQANRFCIMILLLFYCSTLVINSTIGTIMIESPPSLNEVTIDGKWTSPEEWDDAIEYPIKFGFTEYIFGYFLLKDDNKSLYILIDYSPDFTLDDGDSGRVRFDTKGDGANSPQYDDYEISLEWNEGVLNTKIRQGNGTDWIINNDIHMDISAMSTNDVENNPHSKNPHMIYEFDISKDFIGNKSEIGFSASSIDWSVERARALEQSRNKIPRYISFPIYSNHLKPSTWAKLSLSTPYEKPSPSSASIETPTTTPLPKTNQPPTTTPLPTPSNTPKPTHEPTISSEPSPTVPEESLPKSKPLFSQIFGGYFTMTGIIVIIMLAITSILVIRRK